MTAINQEVKSYSPCNPSPTPNPFNFERDWLHLYKKVNTNLIIMRQCQTVNLVNIGNAVLVHTEVLSSQ